MVSAHHIREGVGPSWSVAEKQREKILALVGPQSMGWWYPHLGQAFSTHPEVCIANALGAL